MSTNDLMRPFDYDAHKWRVMNLTKKGDKASCAFYIDARDVMDRLDAVVGPDAWSDKYTVLAIGENKWAVECTLTINGVSKSDVGEGDAPKDTYSDALKRAAVKWGVGRYLYGMDNGTWFAVNEFKQFTPEAEKQIEDLLRRNLARLGVKMVQTPPPPQTGNNGHNGTNGADKPALWQAWESPGQAKAWAVECGACKNEFEANGSFTKLVKENFDGRLHSGNVKEVYAAFYAHQMEKLSKQVQEAVKDAPEMVPA